MAFSYTQFLKRIEFQMKRFVSITYWKVDYDKKKKIVRVFGDGLLCFKGIVYSDKEILVAYVTKTWEKYTEKRNGHSMSIYELEAVCIKDAKRYSIKPMPSQQAFFLQSGKIF
jgi:hypothetical protein